MIVNDQIVNIGTVSKATYIVKNTPFFFKHTQGKLLWNEKSKTETTASVQENKATQEATRNKVDYAPSRALR